MSVTKSKSLMRSSGLALREASTNVCSFSVGMAFMQFASSRYTVGRSSARLPPLVYASRERMKATLGRPQDAASSLASCLEGLKTLSAQWFSYSRFPSLPLGARPWAETFREDYQSHANHAPADPESGEDSACSRS